MSKQHNKENVHPEGDPVYFFTQSQNLNMSYRERWSSLQETEQNYHETDVGSVEGKKLLDKFTCKWPNTKDYSMKDSYFFQSKPPRLPTPDRPNYRKAFKKFQEKLIKSMSPRKKRNATQITNCRPP